MTDMVPVRDEWVVCTAACTFLSPLPSFGRLLGYSGAFGNARVLWFVLLGVLVCVESRRGRPRRLVRFWLPARASGGGLTLLLKLSFTTAVPCQLVGSLRMGDVILLRDVEVEVYFQGTTRRKINTGQGDRVTGGTGRSNTVIRYKFDELA
ncbi:hypothetical protein NXS19_001722 [Fusarium pseudograminearum]|nr:hypothetical protein NXS19_001722 [Fusarium pseudograminearum]